MKKNNNPTKTIIGDKRTHGSKNIPLFWDSKRYFKENVYHTIASGFIVIAVILLVIYVILSNTIWQKIDMKTQLWITAPAFACIFGFAICKINERKIRKQRIYDLAGSEGRTIESI
ncbi:MAG: hypothetical protein LBV53_00825 [Mycoplasmataceae bacterium]|jgi:hypothetical protein|nr:hypothetical protein [Mycoplasmataceae bacterium]